VSVRCGFAPKNFIDPRVSKAFRGTPVKRSGSSSKHSPDELKHKAIIETPTNEGPTIKSCPSMPRSTVYNKCRKHPKDPTVKPYYNSIKPYLTEEKTR
jgi:hypothetical protein